jgi:hypothetical protein
MQDVGTKIGARGRGDGGSVLQCLSILPLIIRHYLRTLVFFSVVFIQMTLAIN